MYSSSPAAGNVTRACGLKQPVSLGHRLCGPESEARAGCIARRLLRRCREVHSGAGRVSLPPWPRTEAPGSSWPWMRAVLHLRSLSRGLPAQPQQPHASRAQALGVAVGEPGFPVPECPTEARPQLLCLIRWDRWREGMHETHADSQGLWGHLQVCVPRMHKASWASLSEHPLESASHVKPCWFSSQGAVEVFQVQFPQHHHISNV